MAPDQAPRQLDYAPPPPWHRRPRFCRAVWRGGLLGVVLLAILGAPRAWRHAQLLYWQRRCLSYTAPPDRIIFEQTSTAAAGLPDPAGYQIRSGPVGDYYHRYLPAQPWSRFYPVYSPPGGISDGTAFLHRRTSPCGHDRLIVVEVVAVSMLRVPLTGGYRPDGYAPQLVLHSRVYKPGSLATDPREVSTFIHSTSLSRAYARIYAGQPDPDNPSHFTIDYETADGQRHTLDGWLMDDDRVLLEERQPSLFAPTTTPATRATP